MNINVLLVDDHPIYLNGLQNTLEGVPDISIKGAVKDGKAALDFLARIPIDVVLLDIHMEGMSGMKVAPLIQEKYPSTQILMLTVSDDAQIIQTFLHMNVAGYLLKEANGTEIIAAIRNIYQGGIHYSERVMKKYFQQRKVDKEKEEECPYTLTRREKEILRLVVQGFESKGIAKILNISPNTVRDHRKNLLAKFDVGNAAGLVREAIRLGCVDLDEL